MGKNPKSRPSETDGLVFVEVVVCGSVVFEAVVGSLVGIECVGAIVVAVFVVVVLGLFVFVVVVVVVVVDVLVVVVGVLVVGFGVGCTVGMVPSAVHLFVFCDM